MQETSVKQVASKATKTSVIFEWNMRCYSPEDITLHNCCCEKLKSLGGVIVDDSVTCSLVREMDILFYTCPYYTDGGDRCLNLQHWLNLRLMYFR